MTVILKLQDGTVKEYAAPMQGRTMKLMKCGFPDCDHVACAIEARKNQRFILKMAAASFPLYLILPVAILFYFMKEMESSEFSQAVGLVAIFLVFGAWVLFVAYGKLKELNREVRELMEFSTQKTVNGVPAEQIGDT